MTELVRVEHLLKRYPVRRRGILGGRTVGQISAVDDVSFSVAAGEALALVGESGCGKTTTARSMLHLVPATSGEVWFGGTEVLSVLRGNDRAAVLRVRRALQYMFQEPYLSLNPRWTIGQTLREPFRVHRHAPPAEWNDRIAALLEARRSRSDARLALPARIQRRPAPARRRRAGTGGGAALPGAGRAGVPRSMFPCVRRSSTCWWNCARRWG